MNDRPSYWPMVYGTDVGHGTNNIAIHQTFTFNPTREDVFIWIRSLTGLSTEWASFKLFVRNLINRRHKDVTLCF